MHKIDSNGATVTNEFTEGNASLNVPATVVSAAFMNATQKELVTIVEALGITLATSSSDPGNQVYAAILRLIERGGRPAPITQNIANNQVSNADVTSFPVFLSTGVKAIEFLYTIRRTNSVPAEKKFETGRMYITWDAENDVWLVTAISAHDDAEVIFDVVTTGNPDEYKLVYKSSNLTSGSYVGLLTITDVKYLLV